MSVLIKGVQTPRNCNECFCTAYGQLSRCVITDAISSPDYIPSGCPISDVPTPHGRLIDADMPLLEMACSMFPQEMDYTRAVAIAKRYLKHAPTVIEAEEE